MRLATANDVFMRMNLASVAANASSKAPMESMLEVATQHIEAILRTPLSKCTRTDRFSYLTSPWRSLDDSRAGKPRSLVLWLTQGFLRSAPEVYYHEDGAPDLVSDNLVDPSGYFVDLTKGKIVIRSPYDSEIAAGDNVIAVRYTAGFETPVEADPDADPPVEAVNEVPDSLSRAAVSAAVVAHSIYAVSHGKKDRLDLSSKMAALLRLELQSYFFTQNEGEIPDTTEVEEPSV